MKALQIGTIIVATSIGLVAFISFFIVHPAPKPPQKIDLSQYYSVRTLIYADSSITISERGKLMHVHYTYEIK